MSLVLISAYHYLLSIFGIIILKYFISTTDLIFSIINWNLTNLGSHTHCHCAFIRFHKRHVLAATLSVLVTFLVFFNLLNFLSQSITDLQNQAWLMPKSEWYLLLPSGIAWLIYELAHIIKTKTVTNNATCFEDYMDLIRCMSGLLVWSHWIFCLMEHIIISHIWYKMFISCQTCNCYVAIA